MLLDPWGWGAAGQGQELQGGPFAALQCGGWSLDMGSQAPADAEESSALDPSISHAETSSTGVLSQSPPHPPPTSLTPPRSVALKTLGTSPLSAQPRFSLSCQYLLVTSHCHRQLVSPTSGSLPNTACAPEPTRPGATSMRGSRLPSAERRSRVGILLPQEVLGGAASFCTRAGLQGSPPHHTEGRPHSTLTPLCPGQPWKP